MLPNDHNRVRPRTFVRAIETVADACLARTSPKSILYPPALALILLLNQLNLSERRLLATTSDLLRVGSFLKGALYRQDALEYRARSWTSKARFLLCPVARLVRKMAVSARWTSLSATIIKSTDNVLPSRLSTSILFLGALAAGCAGSAGIKEDRGIASHKTPRYWILAYGNVHEPKDALSAHRLGENWNDVDTVYLTLF